MSEHNGRTPRPFRVQCANRGEITVLSLMGRFDLTAKWTFENTLATIDREQSHRLIVDLRRVTFMDSSGLRMLLELWSESRNDGFSMAIVRGRPAVQRILNLTGADEVLPMIDVPPRRRRTVAGNPA